MEYKTGDKVKIATGKHSELWCKHMDKLQGETVTIETVWPDGYHIEEGYFIMDKDIEGLVE